MKKRISKYSNGVQVSDAQYITEIICENFAKKNKKDLHYRFWLEKSWSKFYKSQIKVMTFLFIPLKCNLSTECVIMARKYFLEI